MRVFVCVMFAAAMVAALAAAAAAQTVVWDFDGTQSLTQMGWTLAGTPADQFIKSKDYSSGVDDGGVLGVNINDDNLPSVAYMRMYKDPVGISGSQGIVMARVKYISGGNVNGTFGYSSASGNHSIVMAIRGGAVNWKTAEQGNANISPVSVDTSVYRVYAFRYTSGGIFDSWYSTTSDWSANSADWVQVATGAGWSSAQTALIDETSTARGGLLMGSFGTSSTLWQGNIDYIAWSKVSENQLPWNLNPVPEPSSLLALASGILGMAGYAASRRRS